MKDEKMSDERRLYLKRLKRKKYAILITQIFILIGIIITWELLARYNIIDSFITSQPSRIFNTFLNLGSNNLLYHVGVTTYETIIGFLLRNKFGISDSYNFMVVRFFKKSCRTILSSIK